MAFKNLSTIIFIFICMLNFAYASDNVAKVIMMRGQAKAKLKDGNVVDVKENSDFQEGVVIQTSEKSFVKLIFIDKSQMNLGPNSQMIINAFPKKEAGIITLVKGQIRSQVTKDYMEMDDKSKSKLYIKTNSAAMGIRGTDFQVNFNPENQNTSLITFEGAVAMSHIERGFREEKFDQSKLEKVVSSDRAVMVAGGQISAVNLNIAERAMVPTKLAPSQILALKDNETGAKEASRESDKKQFRNPIPPGVEGSTFSNAPSEVDKMVKSMGVNTDAIKEPKADQHASTTKGDPSGFFNDKTGEYKMPAGSIIDLKTVNIIPPPVNAVFDPNTKTYIVPDNFGRIDKTTGEYKAPDGLKLNSDGKFQIVEPDNSKSQPKNSNDLKANEAKPDGKKDDGKPQDPTASTNGTPDPNRAPASVGPNGPVPFSLTDIRPDMQNFANKFAPVILDRPPVINDNLKAIAQDKISTTEKVNQTNSNLGTPPAATKVKIILNAQ